MIKNFWIFIPRVIAFLESDQKTPKLDFSMKRQDNIGTFFVIRHYKKSRRAFALISFRQKFPLVFDIFSYEASEQN